VGAWLAPYSNQLGKLASELHSSWTAQCLLCDAGAENQIGKNQESFLKIPTK